MKETSLAVVAMPFMKRVLAVPATLLLLGVVAGCSSTGPSPNMPGYMGNSLSGMPAPSTYGGYAAGVATGNATASPQPMASSAGTVVTLTGSQEVPPVTTGASGSGTISVGADKSVSGSVKTTGVNGTAAHIHLAAMGQNGPVIIPLTKTADGVWSVPAGAKLTDAQNDAFKAGNLYVNVHSDANKGGEIRGQLKP